MTIQNVSSAQDDDAAYFRARARDERRRIRHAATDRARRIHREMADHYEAVARLLETAQPGQSRSLAMGLRRMLQRLTSQ